MKSTMPMAIWARLLLILFLLLPVIILFLLPGQALVTGRLWFWVLLLVSFWILWMLLAAATTAAPLPLFMKRN